MSALKAFGGGKRRPINLFFVEIIIALLFFSISGAVIIKVFAAADQKSQKNARLENVIILAQSVAEAYSETGDFDKAAELVFGEDTIVNEVISSDNSANYSFENGELNLSAEEKSVSTDAGILKELSMIFSENGESIYSLDCSSYIKNGGERDA